MKKLILPLLALLFCSCNRESSVLMPGLKSDYFPLQAGNRWVFISSLSSDTLSYEINDTIVFGEHVYFERVLTFSDGTKNTDYFRVEENKVVLIYYEGKDYIYIDFDRPLEEEWNSYGDYYGYIRQRNISTQVKAGKFDNVTEVFMDNRSVSDGFEFNRYAPDVGPVESIRFRVTLTLINARVNGVDYP
jgi:hypothetical protein